MICFFSGFLWIWTFAARLYLGHFWCRCHSPSCSIIFTYKKLTPPPSGITTVSTRLTLAKMKLNVLLVLSLLSSNAAAATGSLLLYYCNATGCSLNWRVIDSERANSSITLAKFNGRSTVGQLIKSTNPDGTRVSYASVLLEQKVNANSTQRSSVLFLSEDYSSQ